MSSTLCFYSSNDSGASAKWPKLVIEYTDFRSVEDEAVINSLFEAELQCMKAQGKAAPGATAAAAFGVQNANGTFTEPTTPLDQDEGCMYAALVVMQDILESSTTEAEMHDGLLAWSADSRAGVTIQPVAVDPWPAVAPAPGGCLIPASASTWINKMNVFDDFLNVSLVWVLRHRESLLLGLAPRRRVHQLYRRLPDTSLYKCVPTTRLGLRQSAPRRQHLRRQHLASPEQGDGRHKPQERHVPKLQGRFRRGFELS